MQLPKQTRFLPSATTANTWAVLSDSAQAVHQLVGELPVRDDSYVQASAAGQAATLPVTGDLASIPEDAAILGVRITVRARSIGAGSGLLRVEALTDQADNNDAAVSRQVSVAPGAVFQVVSVFFGSQEKILGEYDRWDRTGLAALKIRLLSEHAGNHLRVSHVRTDVVWTERITLDSFFRTSPGTLGWTALGTEVESFSKGVLQMADASGVGGFRYNRPVVPLSDYGVASVLAEPVGAWTSPDGVFAAQAVTVNLGSRYFSVNLLIDAGVRRVGLAKGPPGSFDPTLLASYVATAPYAWDTSGDPVWVWVLWDPSTVSVYVGGDFSAPAIQVARSLISSGPVGAFAEFGTEASGAGAGSQGTLLVTRFLLRGLYVAPESRVVLDWQTRVELSGGVGFQTTTLLWHHSAVTFDAFKVRFGGGTEGTGFFIPTADGSSNTENLATSVAPNTPVITTVAHGDLLKNDRATEDGDRELVIYVRDAATKRWSVYGQDALVVPIRMFKRPPTVSAEDFLVGQSTAIRLNADREFRVVPVNGGLPLGKTEAVELVTPSLRSQRGAAASISAGDPGQMLVSGLTGMLPESVGRFLVLSGTAAANNAGIFPIVAFVGQETVAVTNALAVTPDGNNGAIVWQEEGNAAKADPVFESHQDGTSLIPTAVDLVPSPASPLGVDEDATGEAHLFFLVTDAYGQTELRLLAVQIRAGTPFEDIRCDAGYRYAVPARTRSKDPVLQDQYLPPWDAVACQWQRLSGSMRALLDPDLAPLDALELMFREMGLLFPAVPGYPEAALRRLLDNADAIHRSRYTLAGLRFYLGLLIPNCTVDIHGFPRALFIFLDAPDLGLPTLAMIQTAGTDLDVNTYLFGPVDFFAALTITIAGPVVPNQSGTGASVVDSGTPGEPNVIGLTGMVPASAGRFLTLEGVGNQGNRGTFEVLVYNSPSSVRVRNAAAVVPDARNGFLTWTEKEGAVVSEELKELVRSTIRRELPMSDDPVNPRTVNVVFVP